ncbi:MULTISPECIES: hypothetical protein [Gammaproteobacteria]|jgi:hypothetical protein|uniref:hypothetical protein n=1 Tax=Gammaproteobacteria TaxID=1236 RepID=UPI000C9E1E32|nr:MULTISPECIES: hypothetical protein [Gammaproteobacteria]EKO3677766.1 hypothetical protein [Vibrio metschnikovii]HBZ5598802.1 hypothetical protein [Morganella morganii]HCQ6851576.1 hypothetical protein [Escherichia coli]NNN83738.1 hypothetical protein [Vibrio sp. A8-1]POB95872.1 hypothetical protein CRN53_07415 [Vibrio vulnificus]
MADSKPINEGYIPQRNERGYQPVKPSPIPQPTGEPQSGYIPTSGSGGNPTNTPTPPGEE